MVSAHNTGQQRTRLGHNTTQTHQAQVSCDIFSPLSRSLSLSLWAERGEGSVKTKLTAGRLSPTIITSQHN